MRSAPNLRLPVYTIAIPQLFMLSTWFTCFCGNEAASARRSALKRCCTHSFALLLTDHPADHAANSSRRIVVDAKTLRQAQIGPDFFGHRRDALIVNRGAR